MQGGAIRGARKAGGIAELCREVEIEKFNLCQWSMDLQRFELG